MKKKIEKQIQEEIRRRVLAQDEMIRQRRELEMDREANREALAAMTSLSRQNVDQIARQVRDAFSQKNRRKKRLILIIIIVPLIFLGYMILNLSDSSQNTPQPELNQVSQPDLSRKIDFEESFSDNRNQWPIGETYEFKREFQKSRYLYTHGRLNFCSWDQIPVKLPQNYEIELTSVWLKGKYDEYGFMLIDAAKTNTFYNFQINADGSARVSTMVDNQWGDTTDWIEDKVYQGDGETANTQRLKVKNGEYEYLVNGTSVNRGKLNKAGQIGYIAVRNCGEQTVAFDHLKISSVDHANIKTLLMEESFDTPDAGWTPKNKMITHCYFKNDQFNYSTNRKDTCYLITIDLPLADNFEVRLKSIWKKGEQADYGLVLAQNVTNFLAYQLNNTGYAQYAWYSDGKYNIESEFVKSGQPGNGKISNIHRVRVEKGRFRYFINDKPAASGAMPALEIKKIGLRVCGRQTVAFDDLTVKYIQ